MKIFRVIWSLVAIFFIFYCAKKGGLGVDQGAPNIAILEDRIIVSNEMAKFTFCVAKVGRSIYTVSQIDFPNLNANTGEDKLGPRDQDGYYQVEALLEIDALTTMTADIYQYPADQITGYFYVPNTLGSTQIAQVGSEMILKLYLYDETSKQLLETITFVPKDIETPCPSSVGNTLIKEINL